MPLDTAVDIVRAIRDGQTSAVEVCHGALARIGRNNGALHAFLEVTADSALERAAALDAARNEWDRLPLLGVPIALKDNICTRGIATTAGLEDPRGLPASLRRHRRRPARCRRRGHRRQDQLRRVRDGVLHRELGVRDRRAIRGRSTARRADRAADRRRRSRRGWSRSRSGPTPAARSGSRRRSAVSSA